MLYTTKNKPSYWAIRVEVLDDLLVGDSVINIDPFTDLPVVWCVNWPKVIGNVNSNFATINIDFGSRSGYSVKYIQSDLGECGNELSIVLDDLDNQEEE